LRLNQRTIEEVKSKIDIVDVIGDFVQLKKVGQSFRALSPFTNEKTPSFYVSPSKEIFKCFSSGKGGDAISFLMEYEGLSYIDSIKYLADKYGVEIIEEEMSEEEVQAQNERESLFIVLNFAKDYFQDLLWNNEEGKSIGLTYFKERGFNEEIIKRFELGFSLDSWDHLTQTASEKAYSLDLFEKAGLIVKKENVKADQGKGIYDRFRGRVIFPIQNLSGKSIGFGARTLKSEKNHDGKPRKEPKYLNSPESEVYHKSRILYGLFQAKQAMRQEENVYLVEGYTDVISLHLSGVHNVVSSSGTSLTQDQIRLIKRFSQTVTVLFDGDPAGVKASLRGINLILEEDLNVKAVMLPEGEDPDSYSRQLGTTAFQEFLKDSSLDFITFKTNLFLEEAKKDPIKKAETIKDIVESIALIPDPIKRSVYTKQCSEMLEIDESVLLSEQNKYLIRRKRGVSQKEELPPSFPPPVIEEKKKSETQDVIWLQEKESIRLLINYGFNEIEEKFHLHDYLLSELEDIEFTTPIYREILEIFKRELKNEKVIDSKYFLENGSNEVKQEVINLISEKYSVSDRWKDHYDIYIPKEQEILKAVIFTNILRLKFRVIRKLIKENLDQLTSTLGEKETAEVQKTHSELKQSEMEIAKLLGNVAV